MLLFVTLTTEDNLEMTRELELDQPERCIQNLVKHLSSTPLA